MAEFCESAMKMSSDASTETPVGKLRNAAVAGPMSPQAGLGAPGSAQAVGGVPATVLIVPGCTVTAPITNGCAPVLTTRMAELSVSAMKIFPEASLTTPCGLLSSALVGAPPSPEYPAVPSVPATVSMVPGAMVVPAMVSGAAPVLTTRMTELDGISPASAM